MLESLLSADVVAFHTRRYARAFAETAADVLGAETDIEGVISRTEGREVWVRAYPISIDPGEFEELAQSEDVLEQEEFVKGLPGKLLLRVDRTDLSKNVVRGFRAYGRMLERHPEMRGEVTFLAQLQPSRTDVPEYAAYMEAVGRTAEEINERLRHAIRGGPSSSLWRTTSPAPSPPTRTSTSCSSTPFATA